MGKGAPAIDLADRPNAVGIGSQRLINTKSTLGAEAGMSRATLVRRFQDVVGVAPMAYIMDWRLMKAHKPIKHTMQSLEQTAYAKGFASARTLSRTFKRHYGCTPHELRRSRHEN